MKNRVKIAIIGTVGVPGRYGGFETLAQNIADHHAHQEMKYEEITIYCSSKSYPEKPKRYKNANLVYFNLSANGVQSIIYDALTAIHAVMTGHRRLLFLGVSGAICIPILRMFPFVKIATNVDGIEWKREKWKGLSKTYLKLSERWAVRYSHTVISDNQGIADYIMDEYKSSSITIPYGGDHSYVVGSSGKAEDLPQSYYLALCRIEPENNVHIILEAFSNSESNIVFIGNWKISDYSSKLYDKYSKYSNIHLLDPIYEIDRLFTIRSNCVGYIHGHSAGGTNPSLVEIMHFGKHVISYDCNFNRYTTEDGAIYFKNARDLQEIVHGMENGLLVHNGKEMLEIAQSKYVWKDIAGKYISEIWQ